MRNETKRMLEETSKIPALFAEMDSVIEETFEFLEALRPNQTPEVRDYIDALMRRMENV